MKLENRNLILGLIWGHMDSLRLPFAFCLEMLFECLVSGKSCGFYQGIKDADSADKVWHLRFVSVCASNLDIFCNLELSFSFLAFYTFLFPVFFIIIKSY